MLAAEGVTPHLGDLDRPETLPPLPSAGAWLFYFAPPPAEGMGDPRLQNLLWQLSEQARPTKLVYISTSGVYGDCKGAWVTETTAPRPATPRAQRRLAAEHLVEEWGARMDVPVAILRVGGIYGPGRLPLARIRAGTAVLREQDCGYTNRIHADDLAATCLAAAERGRGVYNVGDGHPSTMTDYFNQVADLYRLPRPPQVDLAEARAKLSAEMMSYLEESRRLDNRKMLRELGVCLRYSTLSEGLAAMLTTLPGHDVSGATRVSL